MLRSVPRYVRLSMVHRLAVDAAAFLSRGGWVVDTVLYKTLLPVMASSLVQSGKVRERVKIARHILALYFKVKTKLR